jgi:hypothetical protein
MSGVTPFSPNQHAPILTIIEGLKAAGDLGIVGAHAKAQNIANALAESQNDPNSTDSLGAQQAAITDLGAIQKAGVTGPEDASRLKSLILGKPSIPGAPEKNYTLPPDQQGPVGHVDAIPEVPGVPGLSAAALKGEASPLANLTKLAQGKMAADAATIRLSTRDDQLKTRLDTGQHTKNMEDMGKDKSVQDAVAKAQNLTNVINNVEQTGKITPQDVHDIQQISTQNMGLGSAGGVHERAARYASSLGLKAAEVEQFLSGNFQDIGQDNPLYSRYKDLMQMEVQNFKDRIGSKLDTYPAKYGTMYKEHPDWAGDIDATKQKILGQIPSFNNPTLKSKGAGNVPPSGGGSDLQSAAAAELARRRGGKP